MGIIGGRIDAASGRPKLPVFGAGQGWSPYYLGTSLFADWDATRGDLLTLSGSNVLSWTDARNGFIQTQATSGLQPTLDPTSINGGPAIVFDAADDILRGNPASVPAAIPQGSAGSEIWVLVNQMLPGSNATGRDLFGYGSASSTAARRVQRISSGGINRVRALIGDGTSGQFIADSTIDFTGVFVVRLRVSPTLSTLYVNGVSLGSWGSSVVSSEYGASATGRKAADVALGQIKRR